MRFVWVVALVGHIAIADAEPTTMTAASKVAREHRNPDTLRIRFELPAKPDKKALSQRRLLRTRGDGPAALLTRSSTNEWFVGVPGVQRASKLQSTQVGVAVTLFGARF